MNKTICFHFNVHQPLRLKTYRFFNMGKDHNYLDMSANRAVVQRVAADCYLPMNNLLLELIEQYQGALRLASPSRAWLSSSSNTTHPRLSKASSVWQLPAAWSSWQALTATRSRRS